MYESIASTYLLNKELREWIKEQNPWALHVMAERLLEAEQDEAILLLKGCPHFQKTGKAVSLL